VNIKRAALAALFLWLLPPCQMFSGVAPEIKFEVCRAESNFSDYLFFLNATQTAS